MILEPSLVNSSNADVLCIIFIYVRVPVDSSDFLSLIGLLCLNKGVYLSKCERLCALRATTMHYVRLLTL